MEASPAREFPDPLDGIQLRTISGEKVEDEMFDVFTPPVAMKPGMVESGVVGNQHDASTGAGAGRPKMFEELPAGEGVEFIRLASKEEFAVSQADRAEISHTAARRMMEQHRIFGFGRDPHPATRTVLLKVHFVHSPKINGGISS
jgi:hypothetical protein